MVDPFTIVLLAASAAIGAVGAIKAGQATAAAASEREEVAKQNAEVSGVNREAVIKVAGLAGEDQDQLTLSILGTQSARQGSSGLTGLSQELSRKTARELGRKDALNEIRTGEIEAFNFRVEQENQLSDARIQRGVGKNALLQGFIGAGQSLVGGATAIGKIQAAGGTPVFSPLRRRT